MVVSQPLLDNDHCEERICNGNSSLHWRISVKKEVKEWLHCYAHFLEYIMYSWANKVAIPFPVLLLLALSAVTDYGIPIATAVGVVPGTSWPVVSDHSFCELLTPVYVSTVRVSDDSCHAWTKWMTVCWGATSQGSWR